MILKCVESKGDQLTAGESYCLRIDGKYYCCIDDAGDELCLTREQYKLYFGE